MGAMIDPIVDRMNAVDVIAYAISNLDCYDGSRFHTPKEQAEEFLKSLGYAGIEVASRPDLTSVLAGWREADGGLYSEGTYICWHPGETTVKLDGDFTADELRAIAAHMDGVRR